MKRLILLLTVLLTSNAFAGSLQIIDDDELISDSRAIESATAPATFDIRILVSSKNGHGAQFDESIDKSFLASNSVIVGVDPQGHHTHIRAGSALGIPSSLISSIAATANGDFKAKQWDAGIAKIISGLQVKHTASSSLFWFIISLGSTVFISLILGIGCAKLGTALRASRPKRREEEEARYTKQFINEVHEGVRIERRKLENADMRNNINIVLPQSTFTRP